MLPMLHRQKCLDFFQTRTFILGNFESYLSPLKSPEILTPNVSKHAYSAPALTPRPHHLLSTWNQIHVLHPLPLRHFVSLGPPLTQG